MTTSTQARTTTNDVSATATIAPPTTAQAPTGRLAALREAIATRRAQRSDLSHRIAAYPATRGAGVTVLPSSQPVAGPTSRFWV